jgi:hypothetical protein
MEDIKIIGKIIQDTGSTNTPIQVCVHITLRKQHMRRIETAEMKFLRTEYV